MTLLVALAIVPFNKMCNNRPDGIFYVGIEAWNSALIFMAWTGVLGKLISNRLDLQISLESTVLDYKVPAFPRIMTPAANPSYLNLNWGRGPNGKDQDQQTTLVQSNNKPVLAPKHRATMAHPPTPPHSALRSRAEGRQTTEVFGNSPPIEAGGFLSSFFHQRCLWMSTIRLRVHTTVSFSSSVTFQ
ncbi:hypothetical protein BDW62DRAFT_139748 [Aspergillus aurantiobrunneus]